MTRSRRLTRQERQAVLSHLSSEARTLIREGVPLSEVDRQLRLYKQDLLQAVRAGVLLAAMETPIPPVPPQQEKNENR